MGTDIPHPAAQAGGHVRRLAGSRRGGRTARRRRKTGRTVLSLAVILFAAAAVAGAYISIFCFHYYTVTSNSMSPTLIGNDDRRDRVLCWLKSFPGRDPRRWEIVIFHTPTPDNLALLSRGKKPADLRGMTIKRIIGLGGETLALRDGDVWTRRGENAAFLRQSKPREVQDALWIPVYDEAFPEARAEEFAHFWHSRGGETEASDTAEGLLLPGGMEFSFRPLIRTGKAGGELRDMPGVTDRYLLPQNLSFVCPACGTGFTRGFSRGQVRERCPSCAASAYEENVLAYSHDSGLTVVGPDAVTGIPRGDAGRARVYPYHVVGDLRLLLEVKLPHDTAGITLSLEKDVATDTVRLSPKDTFSNGRRMPGVVLLAAGEWAAVEFMRVDGEVRLAVDGEPVILREGIRRPPGRNEDGISLSLSSGTDNPTALERERDILFPFLPEPEIPARSSGVSFEASAPGTLVRRVAIDRDVHYFSGVGNPCMPQFSAMSAEDEILIPNGMFFTLGDNTDVSLDSRNWGAVPNSVLAGTVVW